MAALPDNPPGAFDDFVERLVPRAQVPAGDDAFGGFVGKLRGEPPDRTSATADSGPGPIPEALVRNAALGAGALLLAAAVGTVTNGAAGSIRTGWFALAFRDEIADLIGTLQTLVPMLAALGTILLLLDAYLWMEKPADEGWRYLCVVQPFIGTAACAGWGLVVVGLAINLGFWILAIIGALIVLASALTVLGWMVD